MREILFRAKLLFNGKWVYGGFVREFDGSPQIISDEDGGMYEVIPETVGQYTGMTDKNGTKIFEGDICEVTTFTYDGVYIHLLGEVCFKCCSFVFQDLKHPDIEVLFSSVCDFDTDVEVIGNIYDKKLEDFENG